MYILIHSSFWVLNFLLSTCIPKLSKVTHTTSFKKNDETRNLKLIPNSKTAICGLRVSMLCVPYTCFKEYLHLCSKPTKAH